jgi:hypothetical protein
MEDSEPVFARRGEGEGFYLELKNSGRVKRHEANPQPVAGFSGSMPVLFSLVEILSIWPHDFPGVGFYVQGSINPLISLIS